MTWLGDWGDEEEPRERHRHPPTRTKPDILWVDYRGAVTTVRWVPIQCPDCGSREYETRGQYLAKSRRYHRCKRQECLAEFYSEEVARGDLAG